MNQKILFVLLLAGTLCFSTHTVFGVQAYPHPIEYQLPDGSKITITLKGDEKVKWAETEDGYSLLLNKDGFYEYTTLNSKGDMIRTGIRANNIAKRTYVETQLLSRTAKNLRYSQSQVSVMKQIWDVKESETKAAKAFPTTGERKLICILVGFKDKAFTKTKNDFENLFNQIGYSEGGATGSVKDYYLENSYGQFNLTVDVAGPYTASQNMAYYGGNNASDSDSNPRALVREAVKLADPDVDYADYDNDNDGSVDAVYVIYAGYGEEAGGGADAIWAHAWSLYPAETLDGKQISRYSCSAELRGNSGTNLTRIGVICHEFGHVLGAPDYYDTNYAEGGQFPGTGQWDMMAGGSWNNNGATPAHHNGFTKTVIYEWAPIIELETPGTITLHNAVENTNSFYKISTNTPNEYFLLENRVKHKFDAYIPGSGMIIYHVHSNVFGMGNSINATHPQGMYPVAQNATMDPTDNSASYGSINTASCAWTGTGKTEFSDYSIPSSKSWAGEYTEKPITNIEQDPTTKDITFDFMSGMSGNPKSFTAIPSGTTQIDLEWEKNDDDHDVIIIWSPNGVYGNLEDGVEYNIEETITGGGTVLYVGSNTTTSHTELTPSTKYYYRAYSINSTSEYTFGVGRYATTDTEYSFRAPKSLTAEVEGYKNIRLNWETPYDFGSNSWIKYKDNATNINWPVPERATKFDATDFGLTYPVKISKLSHIFYKHPDHPWPDDKFQFKIYDTDGSTVLYTSDYLQATHYQEVVHTLAEPVAVNGNFYVAIVPKDESGHPSSTTEKVAIGTNRTYSGSPGNWEIYDDGTDAYELITKVYIAGAEKTEYFRTERYHNEIGYIDYQTILSLDPEELPSKSTIAAISGYQLFKNDELLASIDNPTTTTYLDDNLTDGSYSYYLTALYSEPAGESEPSNIATINLVVPQEYTLTINVVGDGTVTVEGEPYTQPIPVFEGGEYTLKAIADDGWGFTAWTGDISSTDAEKTIAITNDVNIEATFSLASSAHIDRSSSLHIYPNPFENNITVRSSTELKRVTIVNLLGQTPIDRQINGHQSVNINTEGLNKGIYIITLYGNNNQRLTKKIIKN